MGRAKTKGLSARLRAGCAGLGAALRASGEPGILNYALTVGLTFTGGKSGDIAFRTGERFAVFLFLVVGDESHMNVFLIR
jgi:hypothetical protein